GPYGHEILLNLPEGREIVRLHVVVQLGSLGLCSRRLCFSRHLYFSHRYSFLSCILRKDTTLYALPRANNSSFSSHPARCSILAVLLCQHFGLRWVFSHGSPRRRKLCVVARSPPSALWSDDGVLEHTQLSNLDLYHIPWFEKYLRTTGITHTTWSARGHDIPRLQRHDLGDV